MDIVRIIEKKKLGQALNKEEISFFANGAGDGSIKDYQLAALLMAIRLNGMNREETAYLTLAMAHSGEMLDMSAIPGITVDKHSTGGVGDTTTLVLVPLVAACGVPVAKMSGRGLGHTGGTLDKLESIPGFRIGLTTEELIAQVRRIGCAVVGQTGEHCPADKTLYALRDVTSTVDSLPLIASSIMSKKLASGSEGIVLDVKTGEGALMATLDESIALAQAMVRIGTDAGRRVFAVVSDMDEPLGSHVGNALEVKEAIDVLNGRVTGPLLDVSLELGARMLILGGVAHSPGTAKDMLRAALESGEGIRVLEKMIAAQGGDPACCKDTSVLPQAHVIRDVPAPRGGWVRRMNTLALGIAARDMGAGRLSKTDVIDPSVGFIIRKRIGQSIEEGAALATVHARDEASAERAARAIQEAVEIGGTKAAPAKLIRAFVDEERVERL